MLERVAPVCPANGADYSAPTLIGRNLASFIKSGVHHLLEEMKGTSEFSKQDLAMRDFQMEDYDQVIEMWCTCGLPFRPNGRDSRERINEELGRPTALFLVAEFQGEIVGTLFGTTDGRKGWINRLAVRPELRRKGVAKMMIESMEARFEALGLEVFSCLIEDHSDSSMRLFEKIGYKDDPGVRYYSKRSKDGS